MNTTATADNIEDKIEEKPGASLATVRREKGLDTDYVAGKLHLRVRIIELLEADDYDNMPEPVFIKGYLRAYANLLDVSSKPLLDAFNQIHSPIEKPEKALWQSRKDTNKTEHAIRWVTAVFALGVLAAVAIWWHKNKDNEPVFPSTAVRTHKAESSASSEIRLTDLSKMRSLLSSSKQYSPMEKSGE